MSGGSFDYAYLVGDLSEMTDRLYAWESLRDTFEQEGFDDVAAEIDGMIQHVKLTERRVMARLARVKDLAHAMEWWKSGDSGRERLEKAVAEWRGEGT